MKKGRNRRLIERRNRKIVQRYYYWTEIKRLRFDDAVRKLSEEEFFLSENVIWHIIKQYAKKPDIIVSDTSVFREGEEQSGFLP